MTCDTKPAAPAPGDQHALNRYARLARLMDQAFRIPGTHWRFGWDSIIGLVPGAGDFLGAMVGAYGIIVARRLGAPTVVQIRMLMNLTVDAVAGAIPLLGDLFDFTFKAQVRNRILLEDWIARPHAVRRSSVASLFAILLGLLAVLLGTVWMALQALHWLIS